MVGGTPASTGAHPLDTECPLWADVEEGSPGKQRKLRWGAERVVPQAGGTNNGAEISTVNWAGLFKGEERTGDSRNCACCKASHYSIRIC